MSGKPDIIILGGSVAGASSALALAPEGYEILLLDQATFPREKPCGEAIMPQGVEILAELGVMPEIVRHGGREFRGMRCCNRQGISVQADFPATARGNSTGIAVSRRELDHILLRKAESCPNVTVRQGFRVTEVVWDGETIKGVAGHRIDRPTQREVFHAPLTIGADGRRSVFHRGCGLTRTYLPRRRFGVTGHLTGVEDVDAYVEVLLHSQGEVYVSPCGEGLTAVVLLLEERSMRFFAGDVAEQYKRFVLSVGALRERARNSEPVGRVLAVGPLGFTVEPCHRPGLLLIGDSAGFLDPITGEGMTVALKSVKAAVPLVREAFATGRFGLALGRRYAAERSQQIADVFRFTQLLLNLSRYKPMADRAIRRLSKDEALYRKLLGIVSGIRRFNDLSPGERASLIPG